MMNISRLPCKFLCLLILATSLAACGKTKEYSSIEPGAATARSRANLEVPPDLVDTTSDNLEVSEAGTAPEDNARDSDVLPEDAKLDITRNDAQGWVDVDAPVDQVWRQLVSYWGSLGVDLVVNNPEAGIMETDWVEPAASDKAGGDLTGNLVNSFFGKLFDETTALDRYTLRLERQGGDTTRIHVAHRGIRKIQTQRTTIATNAEWEWVETEEDPKKVSRAISSIIYGLKGQTS